MKNIYHVTRPVWASMDGWETAMIFVVGVSLGLFALGEKELSDSIHHPVIVNSLPLVEIIVSTFGCLLLIWWYKKHRVGCYPSSFIYCFILSDGSNPDGKSRVVGYCHVKPEMDNGEIVAQGASFYGENRKLDVESRVGFQSTQVRGTQENGEITCHIRFNINDEDLAKRFYRHGLLQFRLTSAPWLTSIIEGGDTYAGYLQSIQREIEIPGVDVRSRGYAEWYSSGRLIETKMEEALALYGSELLDKLDRVLTASPLPTLWRGRDQMQSNETNFWKVPIPTPQSIILNEKLYPHIDKLLSEVLVLVGVDRAAIAQFKDLAKSAAKRDESLTLVAYERSLKAGLLGLVRHDRKDECLNRRAKVIYDEISSCLIGDSLLDIGCGNGLISNLARGRFKKIQLLDVVNYLPAALNLPFLLYKEEEQLPIEGAFDTVLLLTVLHHSRDPVELLKKAWAATKKRLIIIESVVGVREPDPPCEFVTLDDTDQVAYAAFVDWFYNRVLHDDIPVPYSFTTPDKWLSLFQQHKMNCTKTIYLGQDIAIGPEYHMLFVLDKEKQQEPSQRP